MYHIYITLCKNIHFHVCVKLRQRKEEEKKRVASKADQQRKKNSTNKIYYYWMVQSIKLHQTKSKHAVRKSGKQSGQWTHINTFKHNRCDYDATWWHCIFLKIHIIIWCVASNAQKMNQLLLSDVFGVSGNCVRIVDN